MESGGEPSEAIIKKDKGKKTGKVPRGEEDKDQMKYKFQGEPLKSKVTSAWNEITDTNIGHVNIDEFTHRVWINLTTEVALLVRSSGITKVVGFPLALITPKPIMACRGLIKRRPKW